MPEFIHYPPGAVRKRGQGKPDCGSVAGRHRLTVLERWMPYDESHFPRSCPICNTALPAHGSQFADTINRIIDFPCAVCGDFRISWKDEQLVPAEFGQDEEAALVLSHRIRGLERPGAAPPFLTLDMLRRMREEGLPDPDQQADNLVLWLGKKSRPGHELGLSVEEIPIIGCRDAEGLEWLIEHLLVQGLLAGRADDPVNNYGTFELMLTMDGWRRYGELTRQIVDSRLAFMAMDFRGDDDLRRLYSECLRPAVRETGFELRRIDEDPLAGSIDARMRVEIRKSRFVVCDLTYANSGAYWEAGFGEGLGLPVFFTCRRDWMSKVHFDARQQYIVDWDPGQLPDAARRFRDVIRATIPGARLGDE